ncbi:MAG: 8-oxo-dGTP diphosphatase [Nanohaloarchaea archaeon]|nr:8-oxo-dGTP diphosphatase [Candidatus Nanohaloarchaea archaeon]
MSDWTEATLLFIVEDGEILLIEKKRGHGKGFFNGPGGKVENDETIGQAAVRETEEETGLKPLKVKKMAVLEFYFGEDPFQRVHVFKTDIFEGELSESEEARPEWFKLEEIPYNNMWPDDKYWLPKILNGEQFKAVFEFDEDGDEILDYEFNQGI